MLASGAMLRGVLTLVAVLSWFSVVSCGVKGNPIPYVKAQEQKRKVITPPPSSTDASSKQKK